MNKNEKKNIPAHVAAIELAKATAPKIVIKYNIQNSIAFLAFMPAGLSE